MMTATTTAVVTTDGATTFKLATEDAQMTMTTNANGRLVMTTDTKAETEDTKTMTMIDWIVLCERSILIGLITGALWALL